MPPNILGGAPYRDAGIRLGQPNTLDPLDTSIAERFPRLRIVVAGRWLQVEIGRTRIEVARVRPTCSVISGKCTRRATIRIS